MTRSNTRRFVNAAWSLLAFQLIASVGAVAVTGWAAFHVQAITSDLNEPQPEIAPPMDPFGEQRDDAPPPHAPTPAPDLQGTLQPAPPMLPCPRDGYQIRVDARAGWCDTGLVLQQGQGVVVNARGRWSNAGDPRYGPAGIPGHRYEGTIVADADLAALIGRVGDATFAIGASQGFVSPASGPLYLSINDVPDTFEDNQGWMVVELGAPQIIQ